MNELKKLGTKNIRRYFKIAKTIYDKPTDNMSKCTRGGKGRTYSLKSRIRH